MSLKTWMLWSLSISFLSAGSMELAQAKDSCEIRVIGVNQIQAKVAKKPSDIKLPNFQKYAVLRIRTFGSNSTSSEVIAFDLPELAAIEKANSVKSDSCPYNTKPGCQVKIEAPNKVVVKVSTLIKQTDNSYKDEFVDALEMQGIQGSSLQSNMNAVSAANTAGGLNCQFKEPKRVECEIKRNFNALKKRPEYKIVVKSNPAVNLAGLSYEESQEYTNNLGHFQDLNFSNSSGNDEEDDTSEFLQSEKNSLKQQVQNPYSVCLFTEFPGQIMCGVNSSGGGFVVNYQLLGDSKRFNDIEAACQFLGQRTTKGECSVASPIGGDPCAHTGVFGGSRDQSPIYGENLPVADPNRVPRGPLH